MKREAARQSLPQLVSFANPLRLEQIKPVCLGVLLHESNDDPVLFDYHLALIQIYRFAELGHLES